MSVAESKQLLTQRDAIDKEIEEQETILTMNNVGMTEDLVDSEGFPRSDIDVYSVRHARAAIIRLKNDREELTKKIADLLEQIHMQSSGSANGGSPQIKVVHRTSNDPFVKVLSVSAGSPADLAGLRQDDKIIQFDTIHKDNFSEMKQLAEACRENEEARLIYLHETVTVSE